MPKTITDKILAENIFLTRHEKGKIVVYVGKKQIRLSLWLVIGERLIL